MDKLQVISTIIFIICDVHFETSLYIFKVNRTVKHSLIFGTSQFLQLWDTSEKVIVYYVPRRTMRVIARRATMLAGDRSQGVVEASVRRSRGVAETNPRRDQSCEHCRESRNLPNCVHWHVLYFM